MNKFMLSKNAVKDYQKIVKKLYNKDISYDEAKAEGIKLLRLFQLIYKPIPKDQMKK